MAETVNGMSFADMIRMMAKSIYDAADDIAGTTEGCVEIEVSFVIETETESNAEFPTYTITRRHYPRKDLVDEFLKRMSDTLPTEEKRPVVTLPYRDAVDILGKCCATCKYGNDIENPICDGCVHGDHVYDRGTRECWEDYDD